MYRTGVSKLDHRPDGKDVDTADHAAVIQPSWWSTELARTVANEHDCTQQTQLMAVKQFYIFCAMKH